MFLSLVSVNCGLWLINSPAGCASQYHTTNLLNAELKSSWQLHSMEVEIPYSDMIKVNIVTQIPSNCWRSKGQVASVFAVYSLLTFLMYTLTSVCI